MFILVITLPYVKPASFSQSAINTKIDYTDFDITLWRSVFFASSNPTNTIIEQLTRFYFTR